MSGCDERSVKVTLRHNSIGQGKVKFCARGGLETAAVFRAPHCLQHENAEHSFAPAGDCPALLLHGHPGVWVNENPRIDI